jgi:hypothetical protein
MHIKNRCRGRIIKQTQVSTEVNNQDSREGRMNTNPAGDEEDGKAGRDGEESLNSHETGLRQAPPAISEAQEQRRSLEGMPSSLSLEELFRTEDELASAPSDSDQAPSVASPDPAFSAAEELFIRLAPALDDLQKAAKQFLAEGDVPGPKTFHELMNDEVLELTFIFSEYSWNVDVFRHCLVNATIYINRKFPVNQEFSPQVSKRREALAEFGAYIAFAAWINDKPLSRVRFHIDKEDGAEVVDANADALMYLTESCLGSFARGVNDPQAENLDHFTREWSRMGFVEKAGAASFTLDELLRIHSPSLKWQEVSPFRKSRARRFLVSLADKLAAGVTCRGRVAVAEGVKKWTAHSIKRAIRRKVTAARIFGSAISGDAHGPETESEPALRRFLSQMSALWPKLRPQAISENPEHPGFLAQEPYFSEQGLPRDPETGEIQPPPEPQVDRRFWENLLHALNASPAEDDRTQALLAAIREDKVIPRLGSASRKTREALRPTLVRLFATLTDGHLRDLTESARGRLMHIKHKFNLPAPDDYKFNTQGIFDPYDHQRVIDNAKAFVGRLEARIAANDPVMRGLTLGDDEFKSLTDQQKQTLLEAMAHECAMAVGLNPPPKVQYDPGLHDEVANTSVEIPSKITCGESIFLFGPTFAIDTLAHEVEHAVQFNLRWRINSTQSPSPAVSARYRFLPKKKVPKHNKYRANVQQARPKTELTSYDKLLGNGCERLGYLAGLSASIYAARSERFNSRSQGILRDIDPANAGSDLRLAFTRMLTEAVKTSAPEIANRPYLFSPLNQSGEIGRKEVKDAHEVYEAFKYDRPQESSNADSPTFPMLIRDDAVRHQKEVLFFASQPEIMKKAYDPRDPACVPCRLLCAMVISPDQSLFDRRIHVLPKGNMALRKTSLERRLRSLCKDYPDEFTRMAAAYALPHSGRMLDIANSVPREMPRSPHAVSVDLEKEMGVAMRELAAQFGISDNKPVKPARQVLEGLLRLQDSGDDYGILTMITGLRSRMPGFENIDDTEGFVAPDKAQLLDRMIVSGLLRRIDDAAPTIQEDLKKYFRTKHNFEFVTADRRQEGFNDEYLGRLADLARQYSNKMCNEVLIEVATRAMGVTRESPEGERISRKINSVSLANDGGLPKERGGNARTR